MSKRQRVATMTIAEDLAITFELSGSGEMTKAAARIFVDELSQYPENAVHAALARCRREVTGRLALAHVIERIDDGWPGPEEAWSLSPKSEDETAVITAEIREAMSGALPLLNAGDMIAARMAFLEIYRRKLAHARAAREPVVWSVSLGHDSTAREGPIAQAVELGRITADEAARYGVMIADAEVKRIDGPTWVAPLGEVGHAFSEIVKSIEDGRRARRTQAAHELDAARDQAHAEGRMCRSLCERCAHLIKPCAGVE